MMARFTTRLAALPLALILAAPLAAQSQKDALGGFVLDLDAAQDVVSGETFHADAAYLEKAGKKGWAPFAVVVPTSENGDYQSRVLQTPSQGLVKFTFATPGGGFVETLSLSAARVPMGDEERRLEYLVEMMNAELVPAIVAGKAEVERAKIRKIYLGRINGAEIFGSYTDETYGTVHWRLVGLPNPGAEEGLVGLAQIAQAAVPISSPDDFTSSLTGRILKSLSFD